jgi:hypothetical protein
MSEEEVVLDPKRDAARFVAQRKQDWYDSMQTKRATWARLDKRYFNYREDLGGTDDAATNEPRANIGVPLAAETVDTAVARIHDNLFGRIPYGRILGREGTDQLNAETVQKVVDYQQQTGGFPSVGHRIIRDAVKYGVGFGKFHFKRETKRVPKQVTILGIPVPGAVQMQDVVVSQSPVLEHVHIQDIFFPMDAPDVDSAEGFIHRTWVTKRQVRKATDGLGAPLYDPAAVNEVGIASASKDTDQSLAKEYTTRKIDDGALHKDGKWALLEYTGRLPENVADALVKSHYPGADPDADWIVTIVDGSDAPLRCEPCNYLTNHRMYVAAKVIDDPGYICGVSIIEFVEKLGLTIDELYNIVLDNMNFIINQQFYINELAGIDEADVVSTPGKVIRGKRPPSEAILPLLRPDISQSVFIVINGLLGHYKEYTGITSTVLGQTEVGRQTATEIASIVSHSATRLGQFERLLEDTFMRPVFERWVVLNQQFIDEDFVIRIFKDTQPVYPKVAPEDIQGVFDFVFEGSSRSESEALRAGQIMQAIQINATIPVAIFDFIKLGEQLLVTWGWKDVGQFLNPEFQQQYFMVQQLQAMKNMGETAKALTPDQQRQAKAGNGNAAKQGKGVAGNAPQGTEFKSALAAVKEAALPQMPEEG